MKTSNPIIKYAKHLLIGLFVLIISFIFLYPQLFSCEFIRFSEFRELQQHVFVSPDIKSSQFKKIKKVIQNAEIRIDSFYSGKKSKPDIIICSNPEQYQKYCNSTEGAGCSLGTPWESSFIILNMQDLDVNVASHEMSHTELLKRLGWWKVTMQVPQWFNEGLALMLDKRFVNNPDKVGQYFDYMDEWLYYTRGGQEILELESISSVKGFFNGNQQYVMLAYMTSGLEVSYWLILAGNNGLLKLISQINQGDSFTVSYKKVERMTKFKRLKQLPVNPLRLPDPDKN